MRRLSRSVSVKAPSTFTLAYVNTHFLERGPHASGAELALRFPLPRFLVEGLTLEKRVRIHLSFDPGASGNHTLTIEWKPLGRGPLPSFFGTVAATPEGESACRLTIDGRYTPPGGVAGIAFDAVIGGRIASATLMALIQQFKNSIEAEYIARLVP